jgi:hypothetical protein
MFQIIWSDEAEVDYIETLNYWIENNQSDKYALKLMEEVEKKEDLISEILLLEHPQKLRM